MVTIMVNSELPADSRLQKRRGGARLRHAATRSDLHMTGFRFEAGELPHAAVEALRYHGFLALRRGMLPFGNTSGRSSYRANGRVERQKQQWKIVSSVAGTL
jgi:hypothetical protein